jgi:PAS domain S-box-containing protein
MAVPQWLNHCRSFIDAVGDQMIVVGSDYQILLANRAFLDSSGMAEGDIIGRACHEVTHRSPRPCWADGDACPLATVLATGEATTVTHEHYAADGQRCIVDIVGSPVRDNDGKLVGLLESMRDVTRQKELEEALVQRNAELEQARHKRDRFTAAVCHELKNIGNAMSLQAQVLKVGKDPAKVRKRAGVIVAESQQLGRLVEDMRDATAIETQRFSLQPKSCDIGAIAKQRTETYQLATDEHTLHVRVPDDPLLGHWDAQRLGQVIDNLLSNAIKYSPEGGEILVAVAREGTEAVMTIADSGLGMSPEQLPHVFEPYARVHMEIAGVGLGLFVTRGIVEAHGGTITPTSAPGAGTTFTVRIPIGGP